MSSKEGANCGDCTPSLRLPAHYCSYCLLLFRQSSGYEAPPRLLPPPPSSPFHPVTLGRCTPAVGMERHHRGGCGRPQTILYTRCKPELVGGWAEHWVPHIPQGVPNPPPGLQSWARWHLPGARQLPKVPPASQWAPPASKSHLATPALRTLTPENQFLFFCLMTRCLMNVCCQFPFHQVGRVMQRFVDTTNSVLEFFLI